MSERLLRIGDEIQSIIGSLLITDINDPRLSLISITEVIVSADLSHAKVYYTLMEDSEKNKAAAENAFESASGFFRKALAKQLSLRTTPKLHFLYDTQLEKATHINSLIHEAFRKKT
jgi:ribosome-binding factor A